METSAYSGMGVDDVFIKCTTSILSSIETGFIDPASMGPGIQYGNAGTLSRFELSGNTTPRGIRRLTKSNCC